MGNLDLDRLRSIRFGGTTRGHARVRPLVDDDSGRTTGFEVDHDDGRQEAVVRPETIKARMSLSTGETEVG